MMDIKTEKMTAEASRVSDFAIKLAESVQANDEDGTMLNIGRVHGSCDRLKDACNAT
jgi:hypothetical protein